MIRVQLYEIRNLCRSVANSWKCRIEKSAYISFFSRHDSSTTSFPIRLNGSRPSACLPAHRSRTSRIAPAVAACAESRARRSRPHATTSAPPPAPDESHRSASSPALSENPLLRCSSWHRIADLLLTTSSTAYGAGDFQCNVQSESRARAGSRGTQDLVVRCRREADQSSSSPCGRWLRGSVPRRRLLDVGVRRR